MHVIFSLEIKHFKVHVQSPSGFMEFDHMTNRYLYTDRYIEMIPYHLYLHL
jgi:hypothetical protein